MASDISEKYEFVMRKVGENEYEDQTFIGLTPEAGRYQGVIYNYGRVSVAEEENPNGTLNFQFEYDIVDSNGHKKEYFRDDFKNLIGDILVDIIDKEALNDND